VASWFANLNPFKSKPVGLMVNSSSKNQIPISTKNSPNPNVAGVQTSNRLTPENCLYTFKTGDSLWSIAQTQLGRWEYKEDILTLNPGLDPTKLFNGVKIKLCN
jgi:hypothetical protein